MLILKKTKRVTGYVKKKKIRDFRHYKAKMYSLQQFLFSCYLLSLQLRKFVVSIASVCLVQALRAKLLFHDFLHRLEANVKFKNGVLVISYSLSWILPSNCQKAVHNAILSIKSRWP